MCNVRFFSVKLNGSKSFTNIELSVSHKQPTRLTYIGDQLVEYMSDGLNAGVS
jgi:hypothetical protein